MFRTTLLSVTLALPTFAAAQGLPDLFADVRTELHQTTALATFPPMTFIENMIEMPDGRIVATSTFDGRIHMIDGATTMLLAEIEGAHVLCLERFGDDLIVTANIHAPEDSTNPPGLDGYPTEGALYRVTFDGEVEKLARLPEAMFANGITIAPDGQYLIAGSARGKIYAFDPVSRETSVWLDHPALKPGQPFPIGVNGLRTLGNDIIFANTGQMTLGSIDFASQEVTTLHEGILIDDFAVGQDGTIYGATHAYNSVVAITPEGQRTIIADASQGATGSTSVRMDAQGDLLVSTGGNANYAVLGLTEADVVESHVLRIDLP